MKRSTKILLTVLVVFVAVGAAIAWYVFHPPKRNISDEKGIEVSAVQLFNSYTANEKHADTLYLNKALQVTGAVKDTGSNPDGQSVVTLKASDDEMAGGIFCTMKQKETIKPGATVTVKGLCSGMLSDVRLRDAVIVK